MYRDDEFYFPSPLMAAALQQQSRHAYQIMNRARKDYGPREPVTAAPVMITFQRMHRMRSRWAREHLFALIGDGTLEDCPKEWTW